MAGITESDAAAILAALIAVQLNFKGQQEVEVLGKKVKFTDFAALNDKIDYWDKKCKELAAQGSRTGRRMRGGAPA